MLDVTKLPVRKWFLVGKEKENYSSDRRNSKPIRRVSPAGSWRRTLAAIGGVSLGMKLEGEGDGAGTVR
jgi:hypothetical protein